MVNEIPQAFPYDGKDERFSIIGGVAIPLDKNGENGTSKVMPHTGGDVIVLPPHKQAWWKTPKSRRIVIYPANSALPFPLGSTVKLEPDSLKAQDIFNLYGPYPPSLIRRAFGSLLAEFEKFRLKDWIVIILSGGALGAACIAALYAYRIWKIVSHWS